MAENDVLKTTLEVRVGEDVFEFKIPTIHQEIQIGIRANDLRRKLGNTDSSAYGVDGETLVELRACACFELLLVRSSEKWPWTEDKGKVEVKSENFPIERFNDVILAYQGFQEALSTFREKRLTG